jgi:hypothetical protein
MFDDAKKELASIRMAAALNLESNRRDFDAQCRPLREIMTKLEKYNAENSNDQPPLPPMPETDAI